MKRNMSNNQIIRKSEKGDEASLKELWRISFDDSDDFINDFFNMIYSPGSAFVLTDAGRIISSAYLIDGFDFVDRNGAAAPGAYFYGVCTLPDFRGNGFGERLMKYCVNNSKGYGFKAVYPSDDGLRRWYQDMFTDCQSFSMKTSEVKPVDGAGSGLTADVIGAVEYVKLREKLLSGRAHIRLSERLAGWQEHMCKSHGGGMLRICGETGCAICEASGSRLYIKELLCSGIDCFQAAMACACHFHPVESIEIRTPAFCFGDGVVKESAISLCNSDKLEINGAYWGVFFD